MDSHTLALIAVSLVSCAGTAVNLWIKLTLRAELLSLTAKLLDKIDATYVRDDVYQEHNKALDERIASLRIVRIH